MMEFLIKLLLRKACSPIRNGVDTGNSSTIDVEVVVETNVISCDSPGERASSISSSQLSGIGLGNCVGDGDGYGVRSNVVSIDGSHTHDICFGRSVVGNGATLGFGGVTNVVEPKLQLNGEKRQRLAVLEEQTPHKSQRHPYIMKTQEKNQFKLVVGETQ